MSDYEDRKWYDGFLAFFREPYYTFFGPTTYCPTCPDGRWKGYYATKYMDYCHYCGERLEQHD